MRLNKPAIPDNEKSTAPLDRAFSLLVDVRGLNQASSDLISISFSIVRVEMLISMHPAAAKALPAEL